MLHLDGWLLASALRTDSPKPVKLVHHNARRSWSQMYGQCRGECDERLHKTPELRQAANRCVHQLIELSRTPTRDRNVEAQVRQSFFEVKTVRPRTVDLTGEFGAPVIAKRESREIVAGAAAPSAAPAPHLQHLQRLLHLLLPQDRLPSRLLLPCGRHLQVLAQL